MSTAVRTRDAQGATGARRRSPAGQDQPHQCTAAGAVGDLGVTTVTTGDGVDDGQPQPGAATLAGAGGIGAAEPLEGVRQELRREAGPLIADLEDDHAVVPPGVDTDHAAWRGCPQ